MFCKAKYELLVRRGRVTVRALGDLFNTRCVLYNAN